MKLDDLKSSWQEAGKNSRNTSALEKMTKVRHHPKLRRIQLKLLIESVLLTAFLLTYENAFDAVDKPLWASVLLMVFGLLFILNDVAGYFLIMRRVKGSSVVASLKNLVTLLKKFSVFSVISSILFSLSLIVFFSTGLVFTSTKYLILAGMVVTLGGLSYVAYRNWQQRIRHFSALVQEFKS